MAAAGIGGAEIARILQPTAPVRRFEIAVPELRESSGIALSPEGRKLAYVQKEQIWIRYLDRLEPQALPDTQGARNLFWSPDSAHIGYMRNNQLWKTSLRGGTSVVCGLPSNERPVGGATWSPAGKIVFATGNRGLYEVSAQGGEARSLLEPNKDAQEIDFHHAVLLPGARDIVYVVHTTGGPDTIELFADGVKKVLLHHKGERFYDPVYSPTGHLLFSRSQTTPGVWALPFSPSKGAVTGEPFLVFAGASRVSLSSDGTLAYVQGDPNNRFRAVWVDREGKTLETLEQTVDTNTISLSPDGTRLAVSAEDGDPREIWIHDLVRGGKSRLTFSPGNKFAPVWSHDGKNIAYSIDDQGLFIKSADGIGPERELGEGRRVGCFTHDDQGLLVERNSSETGRDIWFIPLNPDADPKVIVQSPVDDRHASLSPDGTLLAFNSSESGRGQVFLTRFPSLEGRWQVSVDQGFDPFWNPNGRELFYVEADRLFAVDVTVEPSLTLGMPKLLYDGEPRAVVLWRGVGISPDGQRFILQQGENATKTEEKIAVVENWFSEFKNRP